MFKGQEVQDVTYTAAAAESGLNAAIQDLMKNVDIGVKNTLTITRDAAGTYSVAFTLV